MDSVSSVPLVGFDSVSLCAHRPPGRRYGHLVLALKEVLKRHNVEGGEVGAESSYELPPGAPSPPGNGVCVALWHLAIRGPLGWRFVPEASGSGTAAGLIVVTAACRPATVSRSVRSSIGLSSRRNPYPSLKRSRRAALSWYTFFKIESGRPIPEILQRPCGGFALGA